MRVRPLHNRIIAKRCEEKGETISGIIIPETAKEKPLDAVVVAVGNGACMEDGSIRPMSVKPGDKVLFGKYAGTEIYVDDEAFLMLCEADILGIVED